MLTSSRASENLGKTSLTNPLLSSIDLEKQVFNTAICNKCSEIPHKRTEEQTVTKMHSIQRCLSSEPYHYSGPRAEQ